MININNDLFAAIAYIFIFIVLSFRANLFQWLWGSILLWLGFAMIGAKILPGIWGLTHIAPLFIPHFYITLASLFFFLSFWKTTPEAKMWQANCGNTFLSLFAVSNALMSLTFAFLMTVVCYYYPNGSSAFLWPALLEIYALKPIYWFTMQAIMMWIFYLHRHLIMKQRADCFSTRQLQAGFLLATLLQVVTVIIVILGNR